MGFCIEHVHKVTFEPCVGWPKAVYNLPEYTEILPVVNGHCESFLFGEIKLDSFTGYVRIEFVQHRCTGDFEDRNEKKSVVEENRKKILDAFENYR